MGFFVSRVKSLARFFFRRQMHRLQPELMNRLSHELRTSLTGIVGYAEFLEEGSKDPMMNFTAKIIRESGINLTRTSQSFYDFYALSQNQLQLMQSRFLLSELTRHVLAQCQPFAAEKDTSLVFDCSEAAFEIAIFSDAARISQVLDSLIYQAIQDSSRWSLVKVHLEWNQPKHVLELSVVSSGISVSSEQIDLQTQFWNNDDYQLRLQEGPGVELVLTKALIQYLGGTIHFESSPALPSCWLIKFSLDRNLTKDRHE